MPTRELYFTNRREFIRNFTLLGAGVTLTGNLLHAAPKGQRITILHTNDWHSRIEPFDDDSRKFAGLGGAARRAALINQIRAEGNAVLLLDSGDIVQGTGYFNLFEGELEYKLMSNMGYNAATLGNHDFDAGIEGLDKQLKNAKFPIVCSNYEFGGTKLKANIERYRVFKLGKVQIGLIGLGINLNGLVAPYLYEGLEINDPIETANRTAAMLRKKGCNYIICLSHLGYKYNGDKVSDVKLATATTGIDLILGGHTHTFLDTPDEVINAAGKKVLILQNGWGGMRLGRIDIDFGVFSEPVNSASLSYKISE